MAMTAMNISLPEELKEYVEQHTKAGYSTPSEYVRELIREIGSAALGSASTCSSWKVDSGDPIPATTEFWNTAINFGSSQSKPVNLAVQ